MRSCLLPCPAPRVLSFMRNTAWIWLAGCIAWCLDALINVLYHNVQHAELALLMAILFGIAYAFYRNQGR